MRRRHVPPRGGAASQRELDGREAQAMLDFDAPHHALSSRTATDIGFKGLLSLQSLFSRCSQMIGDLNPRDLEDAVHLFDVASHFGLIDFFVRSNGLAGQHRGQSAHHSPAHGTDNVIQRRRMFFNWIDLVEVLDPAMNTIIDRLVETFYQGLSRRSRLPSDRDPRLMNQSSHRTPPYKAGHPCLLEDHDRANVDPTFSDPDLP